MKFIAGLDIGGTHISGALVQEETDRLMEKSYYKRAINPAAAGEVILSEWENVIREIIQYLQPGELSGIGISMPGPFDYEAGISFIRGQEKYDALYGVNVKDILKKDLDLPSYVPLYFKNDAACFGLGENRKGAASGYNRVLAITLGTGLGAAFIRDGEHITEGAGIPEGGTLYQMPYRNRMAEDCFSARGLIKEYTSCKKEMVNDARTISERAARREPEAITVFSKFGKDLALFLIPYLRSFQAECLVLGGSISQSALFFMDNLKRELIQANIPAEVFASSLGEKAAIFGAAGMVKCNREKITYAYRKTNQYLLPLKKQAPGDEANSTLSGYDIYPSFQLKGNQVKEGFSALADYIVVQKNVLIDGYAGIFWKEIIENLRNALPKGLKLNIRDTRDWFLKEEEVDAIVDPYLGKKDSVWGTKCDLELIDLFDRKGIKQYQPDGNNDINLVIGTGAALVQWDVPVIYFDLPKNELQFRMRAGKITNLGSSHIEESAAMYKRFYFVDWVLLNKHKKNILHKIKIIADGQRSGIITWAYFNDLKNGLKTMSQNVFRVRPWFEPGAWGGQWIKKNIRGINPHEINYAWSFELITPENGLLFESNGLLLEVSFDFIMFIFKNEILGRSHAARFGDEFPIRFDFLDTVEGGNLSIQCHPSLSYIKKYFGENITQDETYYILEAEKDAGIYLGFQENIDPVKFKESLEESNKKNIPVRINEYVQYHSAEKHDLFLIPNGTIHSAAKGNLVLEISATPYIFTFKMYDWLRLGLDGEPRPINIERAFQNLNFERRGEKVREELVSKPSLLKSGKGWDLFHLPTHPEHFYDIHRYEFEEEVAIDTDGSCHVLMLVEGSLILVVTKRGFRQRFHYAETFVIPAAAESYRLINEGPGKAKVVEAFLKDEDSNFK